MAADAKILGTILRRSGVSRDSLLVVHSAFGQLSRQGFSANEIVETLLEQVYDGAVFMPTMTWRTVTPAQPNWDEVETRSHTGILSEIFRTRHAIARSIHPTHSVAGWGRNSQILLSRHHIDDTPVSGNSPYALMRDYDAYILMIGVGLEACTAIHFSEETINEALYVLPPETTETYQCRDRAGVIHQVRTRRHRKLNRDFPKFATPLIAKGLLHHGHIGPCPWAVVAMRDLLREVFAALLQSPDATLAQGASG
jgi:aminoglycoside 3-N-acetyltransferase